MIILKSLILLYSLVSQRGLHCHYAQHNFARKILTWASKIARFQRKSRPEGRLTCGLSGVSNDVLDRRRIEGLSGDQVCFAVVKAAKAVAFGDRFDAAAFQLHAHHL